MAAVKLLDFGLARTESKPSESDGTVTMPVTESGMIMGTVGYMSPEQVRCEKTGPASDIFSVGVVLYEMVTGKPAFSANTTPEILSAILKDEPPSVADSGKQIPPELGRVIERCLNKNIGQRFQSANDLAFALSSLKSSGLAASIPARSGGPLWAIAAVVLLAIAAGFYYWRAKSNSQSVDSLAVLPFTNLGGSPDADYLSDGITESLIGSLSKLPNLRVMSRSAVFRYKGKDADARAAGRELGVGAVLTGRVKQRGSDLSVSAELVKVDDNTALWGEQYNDRNVLDALAVQADIAHQIVESLKLRLNSQQMKRMSKPQTTNPEAYQLYLKGRYYAAKFDPENLNKGRDYLRQAVQLDPNFALAYDGLSYYYALLVDWFEPANEVGPKALEAARKALELEPDLVEAHVELGAAHLSYDFNWGAMEREFDRALELNPNYAPAHEWKAWYLTEIGRGAESLAEIRRAIQLDPLSAENEYMAAWFLYQARRYADAVTEAKKCLELDPGQWVGYSVQGQAYGQMGRFAEALAALKKAEEILGDNPSPALAEEARVNAMSGRRKDALQILDQMLAQSKRTQVSKYLLAEVYAALGDKDQAFARLNQAYDEHAFMLGYLKVEPALDSLRTDPRFLDLLRKMRLP